MVRVKFKMLLQSTVSDSLEEAFPPLSLPVLSYTHALMHVNPQTHKSLQVFSLKQMNGTPARLCVTKANED